MGEVWVKYVPPSSPNAVDRVGFYFHGDTGWEYEGSLVFDLDEWAHPRGIVFFLLKSPYEDGDPGDRYLSWGVANPAQTADTGDLLESIAQAYGVPNDRLLVMGVSGGSAFLLNQFIPFEGDRFPALYAANCGAGTPAFYDSPGVWDPESDTATRDAIGIRYTYGSADWASYGMEYSADYYEGLGFNIERKEIPQPGQSEAEAHCNFDTVGESLGYFASQIE